MPRVRLLLEYDGAGFHGWQCQTGLRTVQGEIQRALEVILRTSHIGVHASGRTDAGVHARGQVAHVDLPHETELDNLMRSLNGILKPEIGVLKVCPVPPEFDARHSASRKLYVYSILSRRTPPVLDRGRVWFVPVPLNVQRMQAEAAALVGQHDFKSFQGPLCTAKTTVRTIEHSELVHDGPYLRYRVIGNGFLKQMVRALAGTLVEFGKGRRSEDSMQAILAACDRKRAGATAPPEGLCLEWVQYDGFD